MNLEIPQQKPWENKKSTIFNKWLIEQIKLSPENWSPDFKAYVEIKGKESEEKKESQETTIKEKREKTFRRYLDGLNITEQELRGNKILDVGCHEGEFVISCMEKGITQEAYGVDIKLEGEAINDQYHNNFFSKDFTDEFPVKNLDYIVSVGAVSLYLDKEHKIDVEEAIAKAVDAINEKGEIRIWPVKKALRGEMDGVKEEEQVISEIMVKLEKQLSIEWELKPTDIRVSGIYKDVWVEQVLIIKHKNI